MFFVLSDEDHYMTPEEIAKVLEERASHCVGLIAYAYLYGANDVAYDDRDFDFEYDDHDVDFDMYSEW
jgi:hypothetical protein